MTGPYGGYDSWKGWRRDDFGKYSESDSRYFERELSQSGVTSVAGFSVLEMGFGNGRFAGWVRDHGGAYCGVEVLPELIDTARTSGFTAHSYSEAFEDMAASDSLDLVVAFDVFEHLALDELYEVLADVRPLLRSGGTLIARVPSGDSPFARAAQHGDMTHRSVIGSSIVRQLAAKAEYEVLAVRAPVLPLRGAGARSLVRRAGVAAARAIAYPIMGRLFVGRGDAVLTPNLVFVLKKRV